MNVYQIPPQSDVRHKYGIPRTDRYELTVRERKKPQSAERRETPKRCRCECGEPIDCIRWKCVACGSDKPGVWR